MRSRLRGAADDRAPGSRCLFKLADRHGTIGDIGTHAAPSNSIAANTAWRKLREPDFGEYIVDGASTSQEIRRTAALTSTAHLAALNLLAVARQHLGLLDKVTQLYAGRDYFRGGVSDAASSR